jgi:hypothetical protein
MIKITAPQDPEGACETLAGADGPAGAAPAMPEEQSCDATKEELCAGALAHYEDVSQKACHWHNQIPRAIKFWYLDKPRLERELERAQVALRVALGDSHELTMPEVRAIAAPQPPELPELSEAAHHITASAVPTPETDTALLADREGDISFIEFARSLERRLHEAEQENRGLRRLIDARANAEDPLTVHLRQRAEEAERKLAEAIEVILTVRAMLAALDKEGK